MDTQSPRDLDPRANHRRRRGAVTCSAVLAAVVLLSSCVMNGAWAATPAPVTPVQGLGTAFNDVSCVSEDWCMAVGSMGNVPMVQVWDGSSWSVVTAPPASTWFLTPDIAEVVSVDCGTPTACMAQINRYPDGPDDFEYLVLWDGEQWLEVPPGFTTEGPYLDPAPYSCAPDGTCLAVIQQWEQTVEWTGTEFVSTSFADAYPYPDVNAVECFGADDCLAVTTRETTHWDGSTWTLLTPPDPNFPMFGPAQLQCWSADGCIALGYPLDPPSALSWDGVAWTPEPWPAGAPNVGNVSCTSSGECVGIGGPVASPTAVTWNGEAWYVGPSPPAHHDRLSCVALTCLAVATAGSPAAPAAATYTWTNP